MNVFGKTTNTASNPNKSTEVVQPPSDSISSLNFSPATDLLVASSWDNQVRCWEITKNGSTLRSVAKASISHQHPVLCSTWNEDGTIVFSGGCDKEAKMWPLAGGQPMTVAMHDDPIKEIAWIAEMKLLVTGSWDRTIKYWDTRTPNPALTQQLPASCYALTALHPLMVVGTADRNILIFDLRKPQVELKRMFSPLKTQTRCLAPDNQRFLVGAIEGRVAVHCLDHPGDTAKSYTFKCHRQDKEIYSVNSVKFHKGEESRDS